MGLLDRLEALDRRAGLAPRLGGRRPNRLTRSVAEHPWRFAVAWVAITAVPELIFGGAVMAIAISAATQAPLGCLLAVMTRNQVRAWDATHPPAAEPR